MEINQIVRKIAVIAIVGLLSTLAANAHAYPTINADIVCDSTSLIPLMNPENLQDMMPALSSKFTPEQKKAIIEDFRWISQINSTCGTRLHFEVFGSAPNGVSYLIWLKKRIKKLEPLDESPKLWEKFIPRNPMTRVRANAQGNTVRLGSAYFEDRLLPRVGTLFHEARHLDGNLFDHVSCSYSPNDNVGYGRQFFDPEWPSAADSDLVESAVPACDNKATGSYGIAMILQRNWSFFAVLPVGESIDTYSDPYAIKMERITGREARLKLKNDLFYSQEDEVDLPFAIMVSDYEKVEVIVNKYKRSGQSFKASFPDALHRFIYSKDKKLNNKRRVLRALLSTDLKLTDKNQFGLTPLDEAKNMKKQQTINLFLGN